MLDPKALVGIIAPLSNYLLTVSQPVSQTDHYLMKAFLRMVLFFNSEVSLLLSPQILPYSKTMLEKLSQNLALLTGNISNPFYVHYLFEALVAFVRISSVDPTLCHDIETFLTPYMQDVVPPAPHHPQFLNRGVIEYMPYIFQLYGLVLLASPPHA